MVHVFSATCHDACGGFRYIVELSKSFATIFFEMVYTSHLSDFILNCRSKDHLEKLQILGHHNSPLCHIDLKVFYHLFYLIYHL